MISWPGVRWGGGGGGGLIFFIMSYVFVVFIIVFMIFDVSNYNVHDFVSEVQSLISWPGVRSCCPTLTSRCARSTWSWRRAQVRSSTVCFPWRFGSFTFTVIRKK